jgi:cytochrome c oxidase cbb3-type subunit 3
MPTAYRCCKARVAALLALAWLSGCAREERLFAEIAPLAAPAVSGKYSDLSAGGPGATGQLPYNTRTEQAAPYDQNAWFVGEGKHLFTTFNCNGCHGQGGGGEGPALMDPRWRYGSEPGNIFASIVEGRPNGMPSFRGKLTEQQVWQLVSYVRALGGMVALDVQPGRSDSLSGHPPEAMLKHRGPPPPRPEAVP